MIERLTKEQESALPVWRAEYFKIGTCTDPADRPRAEAAIKAIYASAGEKEPAIHWVLSPKAAYQRIHDLKHARGPVKTYATSLWGQHEAYWIARYRYCEDVLGVKYPDDAAHRLRLFDDLARSCMWWWPFKKGVVVSDRPEVVALDAAERLHSGSGPAIRFRDGISIFAWRGVVVPERIIMDPESITPQEIAAETNAEMRRTLCERFDGVHGQGAYVLALGLEPKHQDDWGTLYVDAGAEEDAAPRVFVEVVNSTPEQDGTSKRYLLKVDPQLRPMRRRTDGVIEYREPQELTALNAVASTFYMTGPEYKRRMVAES